MVRSLGFTSIVLLIAGCVGTPHDLTASVERVCPRDGAPRVDLMVSRAIPAWGMGARMGGFVETYYFTLPLVPAERRAFAGREVSLTSSSSLAKEIPPISAGEIVVDPGVREVIVALKTAQGDFVANGTYSLRLYPPKPDAGRVSCAPPPAAA